MDKIVDIQARGQLRKEEQLRKLEVVAKASRKLIRFAAKRYWEDLGDELRDLAITLDDLDGTTEFTEGIGN